MGVERIVLGSVLGMIGLVYGFAIMVVILILRVVVFLFVKLLSIFIYIVAWSFGRLFRRKVIKN